MFEDYKIPIAFLILVLIIIFGVKAQAQNIILFGDDGYTGFWTPANLPIDTTDNYVYFYGEAPETKVAKDSGGVSVRPNMRVWIDSLEQVVNGTFDDSTGWGLGLSGWTISGGTLNAVSDPQSKEATNSLVLINNGVNRYRYSFTLTDFGGLGEDSVLLYVGNNRIKVTSNGTHTGNISVTSYGEGLVKFWGQATSIFNIDNFSLISIADSTYGYAYTTTRPSDTTTYYYSQSVWWRQKDKDTIWIAAETDTVTVYPYVAPPVTTNYLVFKDGSSKIVFKNKVDAIKFKD